MTQAYSPSAVDSADSGVLVVANVTAIMPGKSCCRDLSAQDARHWLLTEIVRKGPICGNTQCRGLVTGHVVNSPLTPFPTRVSY